MPPKPSTKEAEDAQKQRQTNLEIDLLKSAWIQKDRESPPTGKKKPRSSGDHGRNHSREMNGGGLREPKDKQTQLRRARRETGSDNPDSLALSSIHRLPTGSAEPESPSNHIVSIQVEQRREYLRPREVYLRVRRRDKLYAVNSMQFAVAKSSSHACTGYLFDSQCPHRGCRAGQLPPNQRGLGRLRPMPVARTEAELAAVTSTGDDWMGAPEATAIAFSPTMTQGCRETIVRLF
ncbi:hypothetical protein ON010_g18765 [Phytophthora cinnamomi]|nr:hypothetical protein ON010_g18765 [Phytophthora cinnamomi]